MYSPSPSIEFRRNVVQPVECIKAGWDLIRNQYWLFVGMSAVGFIIGSFVPLGILMGPMMCGIYLSLFQYRRGQPVEFGTLFKGFDYFVDSLIATLLHMIPMVVIFVPSYIIFYIGFFLVLSQRRGEPDPGTMLGFFGIFAIFWLVLIVILIVVSVAFTFAYPLIVDRRLAGLDAVK